MLPVVAIFDNFFPDIGIVTEDILSGDFCDQINPIDGVTYPSINSNIPEYICDYFVNRISEVMGLPILPEVIFARDTTKNTPDAPHKIHSDKLMGQYSAHVYLSDVWPDGAGTSFWNHETQGAIHTDETNADVIKNDQNSLENWNVQFTAQGYQNRLLVHNACFYHRADPVGGWGDTPKNGRVVLTMFFNTPKIETLDKQTREKE